MRAAQGGGGSEAGKPLVPEEELFDRLVHDLRNPLGVIAYFADAVSDATAAERDEMYERLRVNAQRALHVLEEFSLLSELRHGRGKAGLEVCDVAELIHQLTAELELTERRPGWVRRRVEVRTPLRVPRAHLACALRALLREALRAAAHEDVLELFAREEGPLVVFGLTASAGGHPSSQGATWLPTCGVELELAERVAALCGGRCSTEQDSGRSTVTLSLPATR